MPSQPDPIFPLLPISYPWPARVMVTESPSFPGLIGTNPRRRPPSTPPSLRSRLRRARRVHESTGGRTSTSRPPATGGVRAGAASPFLLRRSPRRVELVPVGRRPLLPAEDEILMLPSLSRQSTGPQPNTVVPLPIRFVDLQEHRARHQISNRPAVAPAP
jgi:hypothetical protein